MKISVIIPTHHREKALKNLVFDLFNQDFDKSDYQVLIVDSNEGTEHSDLMKTYESSDFNISIHRSDNVISVKRNRGASLAKGQLLIFLDDDMRVGKDFIVSHFVSHVKKGLVVSGYVQFPIRWQGESNYYRYKNTRHSHTSVDIEANYFTSMNFSMSKITYLLVGGFSEDFKKYGGEDVEFGYRILQYGLQHVLSKRAIAEHHEIRGDIIGFSRKIYQASFYGSELVVNKSPQSRHVFTFKYTEGLGLNSFFDIFLFYIIDSLSNMLIIKTILYLLKKTDKIAILYVPLLYKIVTICIARRAVIDRRNKKYDGFFASKIPKTDKKSEE